MSICNTCHFTQMDFQYTNLFLLVACLKHYFIFQIGFSRPFRLMVPKFSQPQLKKDCLIWCKKCSLLIISLSTKHLSFTFLTSKLKIFYRRSSGGEWLEPKQVSFTALLCISTLIASFLLLSVKSTNSPLPPTYSINLFLICCFML